METLKGAEYIWIGTATRTECGLIPIMNQDRRTESILPGAPSLRVGAEYRGILYRTHHLAVSRHRLLTSLLQRGEESCIKYPKSVQRLSRHGMISSSCLQACREVLQKRSAMIIPSSWYCKRRRSKWNFAECVENDRGGGQRAMIGQPCICLARAG